MAGEEDRLQLSESAPRLLLLLLAPPELLVEEPQERCEEVEEVPEKFKAENCEETRDSLYRGVIGESQEEVDFSFGAVGSGTFLGGGPFLFQNPVGI